MLLLYADKTVEQPPYS